MNEPTPRPIAAAQHQALPRRRHLLQALPYLGAAWALVLSSFLIPYEIDRSGWLAVLSYWVSFSGKELLAGVILLGTLLLLWRQGPSDRPPLQEAVALVIGVGLFVGGGALFNEHAIKRIAKVPRPYVRALDESGVLGMSAKEYYELGDKQARRRYLSETLTAETLPDLHPLVREHWAHETGYSFPSGHSFAAFACATFFLVLGLGLPLKGRALLLGLPFWATAVALSRVTLGVHSAQDVSLGSALGAIAGAAAALTVRAFLYGPPDLAEGVLDDLDPATPDHDPES